MPDSFEYPDGREGQLSGRARGGTLVDKAAEDSWVTRQHPDRAVLVSDEDRQRASYVATLRALRDYLVPHRFEGKRKPKDLPRARFGHGVSLNRAYLQEVFGHVRAAAATYNWGPLTKTDDAATGGIVGRPTDGLARLLWDDATRTGVSWKTFFERNVLEMILTSPGGWIVCDADPNTPESRAEEARDKRRPYVAQVYVSGADDWGRSSTGFSWVKLRERIDNRDPRADEETGFPVVRVLWQLDGRNVVASRWAEDGSPIGSEIVIGTIEDMQGAPMLPLVTATYGEHPDVPHFGAGLLLGLEDIVIDLFNLLSEVREGYRDVCFGVIVHKGPLGDEVQELLEEGTRYVDLGDDENAELSRLAADAAEVEAGLRLFEVAIFNWALSAKRKAAEAKERAEARSGVALQAEFQLDLKPLLVEVAETLDAIETECMFVLGQLAGYSPRELVDVRVSRNTEFRLEDEPSRIARIVTEFVATRLPLPAEAKVRLLLSWLEKSDLVNLDEELEGVGGAPSTTVREQIEEQVRRIAEAQDEAAARPAEAIGGLF